MNDFKFKTLFKTISEKIDLPDNAVIADLGCKDANFLLSFQKAFPDKIKSAIGVDIKDKWFNNVKYENLEVFTDKTDTNSIFISRIILTIFESDMDVAGILKMNFPDAEVETEYG